jgi:hypothetical protein
MAKDSSAKINGSANETSDDSLRLFSAYDAVCHAEEQLDSIETEVENAIPKKIDLCTIQEVLAILDKVQGAMMDVQNVMTSAVTNVLSGAMQDATNLANEGVDAAKNAATDAVNKKKKKAEDSSAAQLAVDAKYTKYLATQIILKKFQIIKYRIELIKTGIQITVAKLTKGVLTGILGGKGSAQDPINQTMVTTVSSAAQTVNTIMTVISSIVSMINSVTIMNVNGAGMAFFPTPKSITKTDINVLNARQSTTNIIPEAVDKAISQAEQKIRESNGKLKQTKVAAMAAKGSSSAASGKFDPGSFGSLPKFDPSIIRTAVKMLLQALTDAEAVPRYEKLSIANVRFLFFLVTGFEPAGKKTFGIPGFP